MSATREIPTILTTATIPIPEGMQAAHCVIFSGVQIPIIPAVQRVIPTAAAIPAATPDHQAAAAEAVVVAMRRYENFKIILKRPTSRMAFSPGLPGRSDLS